VTSVTRMRLLLHTCCAPCSTYSVVHFRERGWDVTGFWYNPNTHPFLEHQQRRLSMESYSARVLLPMVWFDEYEMPRFLRAVADRAAKPERCAVCYRLRLERAAVMARQFGCDAFSTTLLISPYQDHALLRQVGDEVGACHDIPFICEDLRAGWPQRGRLTKEYGLYRQQYCGCIYSEWERYQDAGPARARFARFTTAGAGEATEGAASS
jgi:predicted adenine nucleotide alpha hydrolase (AANH) superfamily ATPase